MRINHLHRVLSALLLLAVLSACQSLAVQVPGAPSSIIGYASQLSEMNSAELSAELDQAEVAWERNQSASNRARLGLIRGLSGHPKFNPNQAADDLRQALLQSTSYWQTNQRAFLSFQAAQLDSIAQREANVGAAYRQRNQVAAELKEARDKLQAISNIERDLSR